MSDGEQTTEQVMNDLKEIAASMREVEQDSAAMINQYVSSGRRPGSHAETQLITQFAMTAGSLKLAVGILHMIATTSTDPLPDEAFVCPGESTN